MDALQHRFRFVQHLLIALLASHLAVSAASVAPANDSFANAIVLVSASVTTNGFNTGASKQPGEPNHTATLSTLGSDFDTVLAAYSGDTVDDLTFIAANDQDPLGGDTSLVTFEARAGARYEIAVDGWAAVSH